MARGALIVAAVFAVPVLLAQPATEAPVHAPAASTAAWLWQPSMNVFRRFETDAERVFEFYGAVLGFQQLSTINLGTGAGVARFQAGAQELKLTRRVPERQYQPGGVTTATGLRLLTFVVTDEAALTRRFVEHGFPPPRFELLPGATYRSALLADPDGQAVELVVNPNATDAERAALEVGLTVADLSKSLAFYRSFVGLEELPPVEDVRFGTTKYSFRHGATTISLRHFPGPLPADTGSGGIQYVVSNVDAVEALAAAKKITVDQPLRSFGGVSLRTIWLDDPDGITNYFAETAASRQARAAD
jgi:catechol 2,3-dioxygenase-like lactoylglutathione lyase family enzyme